jgi:hypothetical protein
MFLSLNSFNNPLIFSPSPQGPGPIQMGRPQPFDVYMCDKELFPKYSSDEAFAKALLQRNQQITPSENEQSSIINLMSRIKSILENISATNCLPSVVS